MRESVTFVAFLACFGAHCRDEAAPWHRECSEEVIRKFMRNPSRKLFLLATAIIALVLPYCDTRAATFTTDTTIGVNNTNFDGQDIIVINCTLTVDGKHGFSDVIVIDNGTLTHSFSTNGLLANPIQVIGEIQTLTGTNYSTFDETNVDSTTVLVRGVTNGVTYQLGADYVLSAGINSGLQIARTATSTIPDGGTVTVNYTYLGAPVNALRI